MLANLSSVYSELVLQKFEIADTMPDSAKPVQLLFFRGNNSRSRVPFGYQPI
jgi:hypothetical protein